MPGTWNLFGIWCLEFVIFRRGGNFSKAFIQLGIKNDELRMMEDLAALMEPLAYQSCSDSISREAAQSGTKCLYQQHSCFISGAAAQRGTYIRCFGVDFFSQEKSKIKLHCTEYFRTFVVSFYETETDGNTVKKG